MSDSNNKQSSGFFSNAIGVAKKLSSTGIHVLQQVAPVAVARMSTVQNQGKLLKVRHVALVLFKRVNMTILNTCSDSMCLKFHVSF